MALRQRISYSCRGKIHHLKVVLCKSLVGFVKLKIVTSKK